MRITHRTAFAVSAACFAAIGLIFFFQARAPLDGTRYRYTAENGGAVRRVRGFSSSIVDGAGLRAVSPQEGEICYWTYVGAEADGEIPGAVLFRDNGTAVSFLPCGDRVAAVSLSPNARIAALACDDAGKISFYALPERRPLGEIEARSPVLWKDSTSGSAFAADGRRISFTMAPEK